MDASYAEHVGKILPGCRVHTKLTAKRASRAAPLGCGTQRPAERPSLAPAVLSHLQAKVSKSQPAKGCPWGAISEPHSSCWLHQQDCDAAQAPQAASTSTVYDGPMQSSNSTLLCRRQHACCCNQHSGIASPKEQPTGLSHQVKLQLGVGVMKESSQYAPRPPSGHAFRKQDTNASLRVSMDCTAALHRAAFQQTDEGFSLHAWCASVDAASVTPARRDAINNIFGIRESALKRAIIQQLAACHEQPTGTPHESRKRRKVVSGK